MFKYFLLSLLCISTYSDFTFAFGISNIKVSNITDSSATISWSVVPNATGQIKYSSDQSLNLNSTKELSFLSYHEQVINNLVPGTQYYFKLESVTSAGTIYTSNLVGFKTTGQPPGVTFSNVIVSGITDKSVTISWSASQYATGQVLYRKVGTTTELASVPENSFSYKDHQQVISNLDPDSDYVFRIKGQAQGDLSPSYSQNYSFKTLADPVNSCTGNLYVSFLGSDTNLGNTRTSPKRTISAAIKSSLAGQTICVLAGEYRERIVINSAIQIKGEPGAIIDGGDRFTTGWTMVDSAGVYKRNLGYTRGWDQHVTYQGRYMIIIDNARTDRAVTYYGDFTNFDFLSVLRNGPVLGSLSCCNGTAGEIPKWDGLEGLAAVTSDGTFYVRIANNASPNFEEFSFSPYRAATVTISASGARLSGFIVRGAYHNIVITGDGNDVSNNQVYNGREALTVSGNNNIVSNNTFTLGFSHTLMASDHLHWRIWNAFRNLGLDPRISMRLVGGSNNIISKNQFYETFMGIEAGAATASGQDIPNTLITDNTFKNLSNDALLIGSSAAGLRIANNRISDANNGVRFGFYTKGPIYIQSNTMYMADSTTAENMCFYYHGPNRTTILIHHNSCMAKYGIIIGGSTNPNDPTTRDVSPLMLNNIFSTPNLVTSYGTSGAVGFWDYNYYSNSGKRGVNDLSGNGNRLWQVGAEPDFKLISSQPPYQSGYNVTVFNSTYQTPYPGFESNYFSGIRPNMGALQ